MRWILGSLALAGALLSISAWAQTAPPTPPPAPIQAAGPVSLAVTTANARVAMTADPATYPVVTIYNGGAQEIFCKPGDVTVAATTTDYLVSIPIKGFRAFWNATATNVACVSASATSTARITQSNGAPVMGSGGG